MMRTYRLLFVCSISLVLSAGLLAGCAGLKKASIPQLPGNVPGRYELDSVPFYPQDAYQCGPATLAMALTWSGLPIRPEALKEQVYTPSRKGSLQMAMVGATRRHGRIAYAIEGLNEMFQEIAAGRPVIVLQNLGLSWLPVWHYAVVIGYDLDQEDIFLHSGETKRKVMSYYVFEKTWARSNYWGLLVLQPNQIPVLASENDYLSAVLGLEKARHYKEAVIGYQTAIARWPESLTALMGLGKSYYSLGDFNGAESAFREATERHPLSGPAHNNLAHVLLKQGRKQEALAAVQMALKLGGPMIPVYKKTLQEIQSEKP